MDLTTCDREPIHVPGAVQPHGVLLATDDDGIVVTASANTEALLGRAAEDCLGLHLTEVLGVPAAAQVLATLADGQFGAPVRVSPSGGDLGGRPVDAVLHRSGGRVVVELEEADATDGVSAVSYRSARASMLRLSAEDSVLDLCDTLAEEIRTMTGFDRVMVYRFDAQWNGEVVSEDKRDDLNSFLGQHYPATDIPAQARRLYTSNWIRLIADVAYRPVPLVPVLDPATGEALDLSYSVLRSVSPIHLEYLTNMGVTASMSVSLVIGGQLWGMVACHHYSGPHQPSQDVRSAAEFVGQAASQLIANREAADERQEAIAAQATLARIAADLTVDPRTPHDALMRHGELLELFRATGAALSVGGELVTVGATPPLRVLQRIADLLHTDDGVPATTSCLAELDPDLAAHAEVAAGALLLENGPDRWLLWLRPEMPQVVSWGGDPHNKIINDAEGPEIRLSPRKSFEKWLEVVRGRSAEWSRVEAESAAGIRSFMSSLLVRRSREQLTIAESLQRSIVLDEAPEVPGFRVAARYQPAAGNQLGGDWWDTFGLPDGRTAFVVGDVAGHGVDAAGAMAQVRTAVRAHLYDGRSPADTLDTIDRLVDSMLGGRTGTAVIAVVDPRTGVVEFASAGHPPPLLIDGDGVHVLQVQPRPLLGVGFGQAYSTHITLGDATLLLYTDGLVESRHHALDVGIDNLRAVAAFRPGEDMPAWAARLLASAEGLEDDDRTLVGVRLA